MSEQQQKESRRGLLSYVPGALVLAGIAAVGVWGHKTGWMAPKFADIAGRVEQQKQEDWCAEHNVPESTCIKCHPELVGANMNDWCPEHGLPESKCTICHPELLTTGVAGDWCPEHGLPETSCTLCHPEIAVKGEAQADAGAAKVTLTADEVDAHAGHGHDESAKAEDAHDGHGHGQSAKAEDAHDGHGHGEAASGEGKGHEHVRDAKTCQTHNLRVQFASAESLTKAGVSVAQVSRRPMADSVLANGELEYDRRRLAAISSPATGRVWRVLKGLGEAVKAGEVIALIDSPEVAEAKGELLQVLAEAQVAEKALERAKASAEAGFRTRAELQEAEAASSAAQIRLFAAQQRLGNLGLSVDMAVAKGIAGPETIRVLGLPESVREKLDEGAPANLLPLVAPLDGVVIAQENVAGEAIEEHKPVLTVADITRMWVRVDLPSTTANAIAIGQEAMFTPDGDASRAVRGKLTWVDTSLNPQTRTLSARAEVENPAGMLKVGSFGQARITMRKSGEAAVVPAEALQWEGCCQIVFVRLADTIFQARKVKLGARTEQFAEVTNGLLPGEVVAAAGSNVLKAEILKSNLGAGCADH